MVSNMEVGTGAQNMTRNEVLNLMDQVKEIESQLSELKGILDTNSVGLTGPLVDRDGFPRQDIDVYQVRHARHRIICLQNDHKTLMAQIEAGLHRVHSEVQDSEMSDLYDSNPEVLVPIAVVNNVTSGSPSALAGLQPQDRIVEFGTVSSKNFTSLRDIGAVVEHSAGRAVSVTVLRAGMRKRLTLTPQTWAGKGLLGCNILPIESVDR